MAKLLLKLREAIVKEISLSKPLLTIGRKADNDLVIDDPLVSGHHVKIEQVQSVFFIQDLGSSNGTYAHQKRIDRKQLFSGDQFLIGPYSLVYLDDISKAIGTLLARAAVDSDKPAYESQAQQHDLRKAQDASMTLKTKKHVGILQTVSGSANAQEYELTGPMAFIGAQDGAAIKLTGWFAPKRAALLNPLADGYAISLTEDGGNVLVNGSPIQTQTMLKDGDLIVVAGVTLLYSVKK